MRRLVRWILYLLTRHGRDEVSRCRHCKSTPNLLWRSVGPSTAWSYVCPRCFMAGPEGGTKRSARRKWEKVAR